MVWRVTRETLGTSVSAARIWGPYTALFVMLVRMFAAAMMLLGYR